MPSLPRLSSQFLRRETLLPGRPMSARSLYLGGAVAYGLVQQIGTAIYGLYVVVEAGLDPLQLVLVGTALEATAFLFEVPTGVIADAYSRRASLILGYALTGVAWLIMGAFPSFAGILVGQAVFGLAFTFYSGAREAWLSDEVGAAEAGVMFARAWQIHLVGGLAGIPLGVLLAHVDLQLPLLLAGVCWIAFAAFFAFTMTEHGYTPAPRAADRSAWRHTVAPLVDGVTVVRGRPLLLTLIAVAALLGAWSESLDRLWPLHLIDGIGLSDRFSEPVWFGLIAAGWMLGGIAVAEVARRIARRDDPAVLARGVFWLVAALMLSAAVFAVADRMWVGLLALWSVMWMRSAIQPLQLAWINRGLEARSRATVLSMHAQADALGQIAGGPAVGLVASLATVRAALLGATVLIGAALPLYGRAARQGRAAGPTPDEQVAG